MVLQYRLGSVVCLVYFAATVVDAPAAGCAPAMTAADYCVYYNYISISRRFCVSCVICSMLHWLFVHHA